MSKLPESKELERRLAELESRTHELEVLLELAQQMAYSRNYDELFRLMLTGLPRAVPHDVSAVILVLEDISKVYFQQTRPLTLALQAEVQQTLIKPFVEMEKTSPEKVVVLSIESPVFDSEHAPLNKLGSIFQAPIVSGKEVEAIGLLFVSTQSEDGFSETQVRLLHTITSQASLAVQQMNTLLLDEQQRFATAIKILPEGVLLLNADNRIILANQTGQKYLKQLTNEGVGDILTHLGNRQLTELMISKREGDPYHEVISDEPPSKVFECIAQSVSTGYPPGSRMLIIRNVTKVKELQKRIQQQERLAAMGQLAAGIAHNFNNLLAMIINSAELLKSNSGIQNSAQRHIDFIMKQAGTAAELVQRILDFSMQSPVQLQSLELAGFLGSVVSALGVIITDTIQIKADFQTGPFWTRAHPGQIQQLITNLAINARDMMPKGGKLTLSLSHLSVKPGKTPPLPDMRSGNWVLLKVTDTGTGIPSEVLPRIFDTFFEPNDSGTGIRLNLPQVYGIVKQHNGYIDVESQMGKGTTFKIYFPALSSNSGT